MLPTILPLPSTVPLLLKVWPKVNCWPLRIFSVPALLTIDAARFVLPNLIVAPAPESSTVVLAAIVVSAAP